MNVFDNIKELSKVEKRWHDIAPDQGYIDVNDTTIIHVIHMSAKLGMEDHCLLTQIWQDLYGEEYVGGSLITNDSLEAAEFVRKAVGEENV